MANDAQYQNWVRYLKSEQCKRNVAYLSDDIKYPGHYSFKLSYLEVTEKGNYTVHITFVVCFNCLGYDEPEKVKNIVRDRIMDYGLSQTSCYPFKNTVSVRFI
ncbi:MAG: hypothetical protein K5925_03605 [Bacilli bacterium]|nr:hypothetical protein [Bacilli bacterium]